MRVVNHHTRSVLHSQFFFANISSKEKILPGLETGVGWQQEVHPAVENQSQQCSSNLHEHEKVDVKTMTSNPSYASTSMD